MRRPGKLIAGIVALIACAVTAMPAAAHAAGGEVYVALGDSYTAGPLIPNPKGEPVDCGRSDHNYPTLVSNAIGFAEFIDVSCGSAKTVHMTEPQPDLPFGGTNPPQFNALRKDVDLVTLGIGGNDMGFGDIVETCAELGVQSFGQGSPCTDHYNPGGNDEIAQRLRDVVAPRLAAVIDGIQERSPRARLLVVGYPDPVPQQPGCYPEVPIAPGDLPYLHRVAEMLSATVEDEAIAGGTEFVDLRPGSIGHDICQPPGTKWYEGIVPTAPAYPAHPNTLGMEFAAGELLAVLAHPPANDFKILKLRGRRGGTIVLRLAAPFRGSFDATAVAKRRGPRDRAASLVYAHGEAFVERSGEELKLRLSPTRAGRHLLRARGRLKVGLKISFSPIGGETRDKQAKVRVGGRR